MNKISNFLQNVIFSRILSVFGKRDKKTSMSDPEQVMSNELDKLWSLAREMEEGAILESEFRTKIAESFEVLKNHFSNEQLDEVYAWPRYVKLAVKNINNPVAELVEYVNSENYICLTKRLSDLSHSVCKDGDAEIKKNVNRFSETVYRHIVEDINEKDIPACLYLGRMYQKKGDYENARKWYEKILETEDPFNGVTSLLASYEEETKMTIIQSRKSKGHNRKASDKIKELNERQLAVFEKWCGITEARIQNSEDVSDQSKREYVVLMTGYARFERNRDNYEKALELLRKIPDTYPDIYRVYTEEAMVYQFKPDCNAYYDLDKAIETFKKAEAAIKESKSVDTSNDRGKKSKKSILMPMANAYYKLGKYDEAQKTCETILSIDNQEQRAINLKNQILRLAS